LTKEEKEEQNMQEIKYKKINTKSLFEEFKNELKNLEITAKGLSLSRRQLYKPDYKIFNNPSLELKDIDADECDTIYVVDRKSMSIVTYHRDFEKLQFPAYKPGVLANVVEKPEGLTVDRKTVYVIGTVNVLGEGKREGLLAFRKKDLELLWTILDGPEGQPLKGLVDLDKDSSGNLYVLEKGRHRVLKVSFFASERYFSEIGKNELYKPENIYVDEDGVLHVFDGLKGYFVFTKDGKVERREITPSIRWLVTSRRTNDSRKNMYLINETGTELRFLENIEEYNPNSKGVFKGTYLSKAIDGVVEKNQWYRFVLEGSFPKGTNVEFHYYISDNLQDENLLKALPNTEWEEGLWEEWEEGLPGSSAVQGEKKRDALFRTKREGRYLWFRITLTGTEKLSPVISSVTVLFPKISYLDYLPSVYREDFVNRDFLDRFLAVFESLFYEIDYLIDHLGFWFDAQGTPPEFLEWLGSWVGAYQGRGESVNIKKIPETKRREFISHAVSMYRKRGTREGLEELIFFYTGKKPTIIENFSIYCIKENALKENLKEERNKSNGSQKGNSSTNNENRKENENSQQKNFLFFPPEAAMVKLPYGKWASMLEVSLFEVLFGKEKSCFCVLFEQKLEDFELEIIRNIIEEEKPAYTTYKIKVLEPCFCLDGHTYLGVNTKLKSPEFLLDKYSVLGRDTMLGAENSYEI
jgi:phage tail-like protein